MNLPVEYIEARRKYILFKNDCGVTDMVRRGDVYEHYIFDYIRRNLDINGKDVIDIGANLGAHSIEFSDLAGSGQVHSFEPQRLIYYQLCGNIIANGMSNIIAYNVAIGDKYAVLKMENPQYFSNETINIGNAHLDAFYDNGFNYVEVKPLDHYSFENISVIKIDAQGYECKILDGAVETIKKNRPVIFIEIELAQLQIYGFREQDVFRRLTDLEYTYCKAVDAEHLVDYIALPKKI